MEKEPYLVIIMRAIRMVFRTLVHEHIYVDGPHTGKNVLIKNGIFSLMRINGDIEGQISVYSTMNTASYIASRIADNHCNNTLSEIESGSGELCNLITGSIKRMFGRQHIHFTFTCPETYQIGSIMKNSNNGKPDHSYHIIVSFDPHVIYVDVSLNKH